MWTNHSMHRHEAEEMIKLAIELEPNTGYYIDSLGWVEFRKGKFDQALADLLRAAKNMGHDEPIVFEHIGDAYWKLDRLPQAVESWQKALALDPQNKDLANKIDSTKATISRGSPPKPKPPQ